ncbi:MAG: hypothetical protein JW718_05540 [Desulfovibrionaceae bacterium]|nr:hypothetical protein [Desulfovibrionaceae bacterium]
MKPSTKTWAGAIALALVATLVLGLASVWLNIERMDLAYDLRKMEEALNRTRGLVAKLEVERNNLLSPYRLNGLADKFGLGPARAGQMRRIEPSRP